MVEGVLLRTVVDTAVDTVHIDAAALDAVCTSAVRVSRIAISTVDNLHRPAVPIPDREHRHGALAER